MHRGELILSKVNLTSRRITSQKLQTQEVELLCASWLVFLSFVSACQKTVGEFQWTSSSQEHCWALLTVMVLDAAEGAEGPYVPLLQAPFFWCTASHLSAILLRFWVSDTGLAIRYWRVVWGSSSVQFLVRHVLVHETKYVTVWGFQAETRIFQAECPSKAIFSSAFMWTKKWAWEGLQTVIQISWSCTICP